MFVIKRDGRKEEVHFDKITARVSKLCYGLNLEFVDPARICQKVFTGNLSNLVLLHFAYLMSVCRLLLAFIPE